MSIGNQWRALIKRWLVPVSTAELSEIIGRIPEDAKVYRPLAKPASANSSSAKPIRVFSQPSWSSARTIDIWAVDYIIDEDSACGLVDASSTKVTFIPWDSILGIEISN